MHECRHLPNARLWSSLRLLLCSSAGNSPELMQISLHGLRNVRMLSMYEVHQYPWQKMKRCYCCTIQIYYMLADRRWLVESMNRTGTCDVMGKLNENFTQNRLFQWKRLCFESGDMENKHNDNNWHWLSTYVWTHTLHKSLMRWWWYQQKNEDSTHNRLIVRMTQIMPNVRKWGIRTWNQARVLEF